MDASDVPSSETGRDNPAAAKRPKLESPADDDEDISIIEERINVRLPRVAGGSSPTAGPSQQSDGESAEDNQDSKIAVFRNKMMKYEDEVSRLRTQLKREQEKTLNVGRDAEVVKRYLEQKCEEERKRANEAEAVTQPKTAASEKTSMDLQNQCERLATVVQIKDAEIDFRDKKLGNAAKELNEAQKKVEDAKKETAEARKKVIDVEQKEAVASARAVEGDAKKAVAEKEVSALKQKLEALKKSKAAEERKLKMKITELENRLASTEASEQPSSSIDEQLAEGLNEANGRIAPKIDEITKLRADNDKLRKKLSASEAKATRLENARKKAVNKKDGEILSLKEEMVDLRDKIEELEKLAYPPIILDARLDTARLQQEFGRFAGIADKITMKYDHGGVSIQSIPSRPTLPKVQLELKPSFFDKYECSEKVLSQTECSLLLKGFASQAGKEQCQIVCLYDHVVGIHFKNADEEDYDPALSLVTDSELEWALVEENPAYVFTFEMNSCVLADAAQNLHPVMLEFCNRGQPGAVVIRNGTHGNEFKVEVGTATPDTDLVIFVDPKYLRQCVMASSGAGSKIVEVAVSEDTFRLRYGNEHFSLAYYIPTVKPTENGERCYSPIDCTTIS